MRKYRVVQKVNCFCCHHNKVDKSGNCYTVVISLGMATVQVHGYLLNLLVLELDYVHVCSVLTKVMVNVRPKFTYFNS